MSEQNSLRSSQNGNSELIGTQKLINCPRTLQTSSGCNTAESQRVVYLRKFDVITMKSTHKDLIIGRKTWFSIVRVDKI